ncbi:OsmC family protein [Pseudoruegeria sp. SK021]|uniref:OsmC family protein n=1 Tax=Pseudoruegeria sp. SK021 TaxID=1933035 RepID=UPI000A219D0A|nr:OsmC family protein [Pseudoruegeria sp. SK021]OSP55197.1 OsmC family peroxiredoxin [Pseudoruegeria sp. SK021]
MKRHATAIWEGSLVEGKGVLSTQSGAFDGVPYSFKGRFQDESGKSGTNPEELIGAAHAGCFVMQLAHMLAGNDTPADQLDATANIDMGEAPGGGFQINSSTITLKAKVPGIDDAKFQEIATKAKDGCPVSKALTGIEIKLDATLV